jgi:hypothetical protein
VQEKDIDIASVLENYLLNLYIVKLNILFFKAEKDQFFSTLLTNQENLYFKDNKENIINENNEKPNTIKTVNEKEKKGNNEKTINLESIHLDKEMIEKLSKIYFDNLILSDEQIRLIQKPRANQIDIILGLNLPGIRTSIKKLLKSIKDNVVEKYSGYESNLRFYLEEEERKGAVQDYIKGIKALNDYTIRLIKNDKLLMQIINENNKNNNELYTLLINDYYILFLSNIYKNIKNKEKNKEEQNISIDIFENNKKFLMYMIDIRNRNILPLLKENNKEKVEKEILIFLIFRKGI